MSSITGLSGSAGSQAQPVDIQVGITDGSKTEVISGPLKENDQVIIALSSSAAQSPTVVNPFQPQRGPGFR